MGACGAGKLLNAQFNEFCDAPAGTDLRDYKTLHEFFFEYFVSVPVCNLISESSFSILGAAKKRSPAASLRRLQHILRQHNHIVVTEQDFERWHTEAKKVLCGPAEVWGSAKHEQHNKAFIFQSALSRKELREVGCSSPVDSLQTSRFYYLELPNDESEQEQEVILAKLLSHNEDDETMEVLQLEKIQSCNTRIRNARCGSMRRLTVSVHEWKFAVEVEMQEEKEDADQSQAPLGGKEHSEVHQGSREIALKHWAFHTLDADFDGEGEGDESGDEGEAANEAQGELGHDSGDNLSQYSESEYEDSDDEMPHQATAAGANGSGEAGASAEEVPSAQAAGDQAAGAQEAGEAPLDQGLATAVELALSRMITSSRSDDELLQTSMSVIVAAVAQELGVGRGELSSQQRSEIRQLAKAWVESRKRGAHREVRFVGESTKKPDGSCHYTEMKTTVSGTEMSFQVGEAALVLWGDVEDDDENDIACEKCGETDCATSGDILLCDGPCKKGQCHADGGVLMRR